MIIGNKLSSIISNPMKNNVKNNDGQTDKLFADELQLNDADVTDDVTLSSDKKFRFSVQISKFDLQQQTGNLHQSGFENINKIIPDSNDHVPIENPNDNIIPLDIDLVPDITSTSGSEVVDLPEITVTAPSEIAVKDPSENIVTDRTESTILNPSESVVPDLSENHDSTNYNQLANTLARNEPEIVVSKSPNVQAEMVGEEVPVYTSKYETRKGSDETLALQRLVPAPFSRSYKMPTMGDAGSPIANEKNLQASSNLPRSNVTGDFQAKLLERNFTNNSEVHTSLKGQKLANFEKISYPANQVNPISSEIPVSVGNFLKIVSSDIVKFMKVTPAELDSSSGQISTTRPSGKLIVQLQPQNLGLVSVKISNAGGRIVVEIETNNIVTEKILKGEMHGVIDKLQRDGFMENEVSVRLNQDLEKSAERQQQERLNKSPEDALDFDARDELNSNEDKELSKHEGKDRTASAEQSGVSLSDNQSSAKVGVYI